MTVMLFSLSVLFLQCHEPSQDAMALLHRMTEYRQTAFATASVTWVQSSSLSPPRWHRSRIAGPSNWTFERIHDPDGVVLPSQLGERRSCTEEYNLWSGGDCWQATEMGSMIHSQGSRRYGFTSIDIRTVGVGPEIGVSVSIENVLKDFIRTGREWRCDTKESGVAVVVGQFPSSKITWWIDTKRGHNPIKVERTSNGEVVSRAVSTIDNFNGVWFPKKIVCMDIVRGVERTATIDIERAEFDSPTHPPVLTLAHIGAVPYQVIMGKGPRKVWDGTQIVLQDHVRRQIMDGTLPQESQYPYRDYLDRCNASDGGRWPAWYSDPNYGITKPSDVDEWEKYVRRFCLIRKCDDRQKASAQGILDDCRKAATPILARIKADQAKEKDAAKRDAMLWPIADIFTRILVPRLNALLTIPQSQPASQPAVKAGSASSKL